MAALATEGAWDELKRTAAGVGEVRDIVELRKVAADKTTGESVSVIRPVQSAPFIFCTKCLISLWVESGDVVNQLVEDFRIRLAQLVD